LTSNFFFVCFCFLNVAEQLGLASPENYAYLSQSGTYTVEGTNDVQEFQETMKGNIRSNSMVKGRKRI
jgi:myosin heavy subunit